MKIITWNVNSIRARLARLEALLGRHAPDAVLLQETKTTDDNFPAAALEGLGYRAEAYGQKGYNGVALLARHPIAHVQRGFPGDPTPEARRVIGGEVCGIRLLGVYVVNGKSLASDSFQVKLTWLDQLTRWIREAHDPAAPLLVAGDFNIAPDDRDVYDPKLWHDRLLCSDEERQRLRRLLDWGLLDLLREREDGGGQYTWWDYRFGMFKQDRGLRLDLALGTAPVARRLRAVTVDRVERDPAGGEGKPSDHAPVIVELEDS